MDLDDLFAYSTAKCVKIRDARLGILHYFLMLCIALYVVVYDLLYNLGYYKMTAAANTVRLTLQEPTNNCNPNKPKCQDAFAPLSSLPYCCNSSCTTIGTYCSCPWSPGKQLYNCTYLDGNDASTVRETSIMVTSLTHQYLETRNQSCFTSYPFGANTCSKVWILDQEFLYYTASVESYTMLIDHSVIMPSVGISATSTAMVGALYVNASGPHPEIQSQLCDANPTAVSSLDGPLTNSAPCYIPPNKTKDGLDFFTLDVLLQSMGISLEDTADSGASTRYDGLVATLTIQYSNTRQWRGLTDKIRYTYVPAVVPGSSFKVTQLSQGPTPSKRVQLDQHGILVEVLAGGTLATFSFSNLLVQLTTSLTLLAMATVGVNYLAMYALKYRHYYSEAIIETTEDFQFLGELEHVSEEEIVQELTKRNLPTAGTKYKQILRLLEHGWKPEGATSTHLAEVAEHIASVQAQQSQRGGSFHSGQGTPAAAVSSQAIPLTSAHATSSRS